MESGGIGAAFNPWGVPMFKTIKTVQPESNAEQTAFDDWLEHLDHGVSDEPTPYDVRCQLPYRITTDALKAIDAADPDKPGLFWVSYPEPHNPYQVPRPYFDLVAPEDIPDRISGPEATKTKGGAYAWLRKLQEEKRPGYDDNWRRYAANYLGMLRLLDDQIRRLHEGLRQRPRLTIVLADHGDYVGEYGLQRKGAGLSEFLMRIPLIMAGDGITSQQRDEPVSIVDVLPTICEAVDQPIPDGVQGRSLLPLAHGEAAPAEEFQSIIAEQGFGGRTYDVSDRPPLHFAYDGPTFDELNTVTQSGAARMLRSGRWKLIVHADLAGELYDLSRDPAELDNLFDDDRHLATRARLLHQLARWQARLTDDLPNGNYVPLRLAHNWRWAPQGESP